MRGIERGIDFGEVPHMRPVQDGGAELDRLDRVLPAMARQRTADEHDRRHPVHEPKLSQRIDDIDVVLGLRQSPVRAQPGGEAGGVRDLDDARPAIGVPGRDHGQQSREAVAEPPVRLDQRRFFARVGRGRGNRRALADRGAQCGEAVEIRRRFRHVELEVAGGGDAGRTEIAQSRGVGRRLRQAEIEAAQHRADGRRGKPPAIERALRNAAVDQDQRNGALRTHYD